MSDKDINKMDFKELRQEVQNLRDEFALFMREYNDTIYNLDSDNFGRSFTVEQKNMKTQLKMTAEGLKSTVAKMDNFSTVEQTAAIIRTTVNEEYVTSLIGDDVVTDAVLQSQITQTSESILLSVSAEYETKDDATSKYSNLSTSINQTAGSISILAEEIDDVGDDVSNLQSEITLNKNSISAIVSGSHTKNMLDGYLTGIEIAPGSIKMLDDTVYSVYNSQGLRFYDAMNQAEGWAVEPDSSYGGMFNYYVNDSMCYSFGTGISGTGYTATDMVLKAVSKSRGKFVVDVTNSGSREVKFVGLDQISDIQPYIYANGKLLATQDWVKAQNYGSGGGTGGTVVAVFG